jgi:heme exporter protein C
MQYAINYYDDKMIYLASPAVFNKFFKKITLPLFLLSVVLFGIGIYYSIFDSPEDYQQGSMVRIMYVHVPAAWMALGVYLFIGLCSISSIVWKTRMSYFMAIASAPIGAVFAAVTLVTGALWGKPIWGIWWVWDARLTSMLVLFLLYLAYIGVVSAGDDLYRAEKPASVVALIGIINVPIVKFSVDFWNSLHQPASVFKSGGPAIDPSMLKPLIIMFLAYMTFFIAMLLLRTKTILNNEKTNAV